MYKRQAYINSVTIGISSEIYTGLGTVSLRNGSLIAQGSKIPARSAPYPVGVGSYGEEFDAAYAIVQVKDTTNDRYEFAEIMMVDDDDRVFMTEYGNVITGAGAGSVGGIGTIDGRRDGSDCFTEITFVPKANTACLLYTSPSPRD